ncbi:hypothetical protein [Rugamonas rubra]|uniref:Uncharacterized protein n=1 Tax=Rugamonas rubra TaxID=758825 RepID=A0A1I4I8B1_9BURK|nr:hypothetical protein [Rugamonas rubra]SFL50001.1 hypothetical protein SAMN02982985_00512 [Rugamonas rubra]
MATAKTASHKIKYALYLHGWTFEHGISTVLEANGKKVPPDEYEKTMQGHIFCATCKTNLNRVPHDKEHFSNKRDAHFRHLPRYEHVPCVHRTKRPEGKRYDTFEEASRAIDAGNLVVVQGFISEKPELPPGPAGEYDETAVENPDGPLSEVAISRHTGETFPLPSKVKTVRGICRGFDENLKKYYVFPGMTYAIRLDGLLHDIADVTDTDDSPKLYFGIIQGSFVAGKGYDHNVRMTRITCNPDVQDFTLKTLEGVSKERGLSDKSVGRIVLSYGRVTTSGMGLSIEDVGWGGFDLLPEKYNKFLML